MQTVYPTLTNVNDLYAYINRQFRSVTIIEPDTFEFAWLTEGDDQPRSVPLRLFPAPVAFAPEAAVAAAWVVFDSWLTTHPERQRIVWRESPFITEHYDHEARERYYTAVLRFAVVGV